MDSGNSESGNSLRRDCEARPEDVDDEEVPETGTSVERWELDGMMSVSGCCVEGEVDVVSRGCWLVVCVVSCIAEGWGWSGD